MKEETRKLLGKAERAISAAETLLAQESADFAVGRAYYAMFYVAEALLSEKGSAFGNMEVCMRHSESTSSKPVSSTRNFTGFFWMPLTPG